MIRHNRRVPRLGSHRAGLTNGGTVLSLFGGSTQRKAITTRHSEDSGRSVRLGRCPWWGADANSSQLPCGALVFYRPLRPAQNTHRMCDVHYLSAAITPTLVTSEFLVESVSLVKLANSFTTSLLGSHNEAKIAQFSATGDQQLRLQRIATERNASQAGGSWLGCGCGRVSRPRSRGLSSSITSCIKSLSMDRTTPPLVESNVASTACCCGCFFR